MRVAEVQNERIILAEREKVCLNGQKGAIVKILGCGLCGSDIVK